VASISAVGYKAGTQKAADEIARRELEDEGIAVHEVMRFEHAVTCLIDCNAVERAMQIFHERFEITDTEVADVA
jgi:aspartokinase